MPSKADQIKDALVQDGRWYVGQENIPWNTPFILVITDDGSGLFNTATASSQLLGLCGIPNRPIKQNPDSPRMHSFIAILVGLGIGAGYLLSKAIVP